MEPVSEEIGEGREERGNARVELAGETKGSGNTRHDLRDETVQLAVSGRVDAELLLEDVVKCLVVEVEGEIGLLNELVEGKDGVVGLDDGLAAEENRVRRLKRGTWRERGNGRRRGGRQAEGPQEKCAETKKGRTHETLGEGRTE